jgi:hypothetical protein
VEHRGFVYWLYTLSLQTDLKNNRARKLWDELRDGFVLLNDREGWNPQARPPRVYKGKGYTATYPIDVWIRPTGKSTDPACELELFGEDKRSKGVEDEEARAARAGHLHVVVLGKDEGKESAAVLREHFLTRQVAEGLGKLDDMKLEVILDREKKPLDRERDFGTARGRVVKYRLSSPSFPARFVVLASIPQGEQTIGIYSDSAFDRRDFWEQEINAVLDGFTVEK